MIWIGLINGASQEEVFIKRDWIQKSSGIFTPLRGSPSAVQNALHFVNPGESSSPTPTANKISRLIYLAVREGFEPSVRCRTHTFQACSFDHSDTSPFFCLCSTCCSNRRETLQKGSMAVKTDYRQIDRLVRLLLSAK